MKLYYCDDRPNQELEKAIDWAGRALSITVAVICVYSFFPPLSHRPLPQWFYFIGGLWAMAPPVWFWWEFNTIFRKYGRREEFDLFKYHQQVAAGAWGGLVAFLTTVVASHVGGPLHH